MDQSSNGDVNHADEKPEPVLPLFVQMNVRWEGIDVAWREASRSVYDLKLHYYVEMSSPLQNAKHE